MSVRKPTTKRKAKIASTKQFKPKSGKKVLKKALQSKAAQKLKRGIGPAIGAWTLYDVYDFGMPAISKSHAKSFGKEYGLGDDLTTQDYRKFWKGMHQDIKKGTKERMAKSKGPSLFRKSKKDILKSVGRKKGGKVGRPIGVGVAERGFGKAMKNG